MSHRGADDLSKAIDDWLNRGHAGGGGVLDQVLDALEGGLLPVADDPARERVRRRLATATPRSSGLTEVLLARALDQGDRLQHRLREDEYVPWGAIAGVLAVAAGVALAFWLRRRDQIGGGQGAKGLA